MQTRERGGRRRAARRNQRARRSPEPPSPGWGKLRRVILSLESVTFRRGGNEILRGLDWQVREDEHWAVVGPNGAGKTTLLRIAAARAHPTTGTIDVLG